MPPDSNKPPKPEAGEDTGKPPTTIPDLPEKTRPPNVLAGIQITDRQIENWFGDSVLDVEQEERKARIKKGGAALAQLIKDNTNGSPDQSAAIRLVREATMTAVAAIALRGR